MGKEMFAGRLAQLRMNKGVSARDMNSWFILILLGARSVNDISQQR